MSKCNCDCHKLSQDGTIIYCQCCKCNRLVVPAKCEIGINADGNIMVCTECNEQIEKCKCVWAAIRDIQDRLNRFPEKYVKVSIFESNLKIDLDKFDRIERMISSLGLEVIELKDILRFLKNQQDYDLPSIKHLNDAVTYETVKQENIKLREKIDVLMQRLDRKNIEILELEKQIKSCDRGLRDYATTVADLNYQIHRLQNPQLNPFAGVHAGGESCEPINKTGIDRYGNEVPIVG